MINVTTREGLCTPGHKALAEIRISVFVGHKHVAVLQMVLRGSGPSPQEPPISVDTTVTGQVGVQTKQHLPIEVTEPWSALQEPKGRP